MERTDYFYKNERYAVGLTGDNKRKFGIVAIKYDADGKSKGRLIKEFCYHKTFDEAQSFLDNYAKSAGFEKY